MTKITLGTSQIKDIAVISNYKAKLCNISDNSLCFMQKASDFSFMTLMVFRTR